MNTDTDITVLNDALAMEGGGPDAEAKRKKLAEAAQVREAFKQIDEAREYDADVRKQFARDRQAARGDTPQEVSVPIIGGNIDTMKSFIYARDPAVDCTPSQMVEAPKEPPPVPPIAPTPPAGIGGIMQDPTQLLNDPAVAAGLAEGGPEGAAAQVGASLANERLAYEEAEAQFQAKMMVYQAELNAWQQQQAEKRQRKLERSLFAQTMEVVISKLWKKARIKRKARKAVGSSLTVSVGWVKPMWVERNQRDPQIQDQINDLQAMAIRIEREQQAIDEGYCKDEDEKYLTIHQQIKALMEKGFVQVHRGYVLDFVPAENIQVAPGTDIMDCADSPWMSEFLYMTVSDALVTFPDVPQEKIRQAQRYQRVKPDCDYDRDRVDLSEKDAEQYQTSENVTAGQKPSDADFLQVVELWKIEDGTVYTGIRGVDCWVKPPAPPNVKSPRFYPYFPLAFIEVDGERYPTSMTSRSVKLQNERNGRRTALRIARHRSIPAVFFDETEIDVENAKKIEKSASQELIGLRTTSGRPLTECFAPKPVISIDPTLYDTAPVDRDMELVWGIQEALTGSVQVDKTATEAEIQQGGFQSRTGAMRDQLEDWLSDIARYTATIAVQYLTREDVLMLAGPDAVWPELDTPEELETIMDIDIRAGSSGKPNTRSERESWQVALPLIQQSIDKVGMLRQASPSELADNHEALVQKTLDVMDDKTDISRLIPQNEGMAQGGMPMPGQGGPVNPEIPVPTDPLAQG